MDTATEMIFTSVENDFSHQFATDVRWYDVVSPHPFTSGCGWCEILDFYIRSASTVVIDELWNLNTEVKYVYFTSVFKTNVVNFFFLSKYFF